MKWSLLVLVLLGGCGFGAEDVGSVPDSPGYERDVLPLLASHCLLCHGAEPARGAPDYFRLDLYDDQDGIAGARTMGLAMVMEVEAMRMPPAASRGDGLGPNGRALLKRWVAQNRPP
jgi:hypothetical protein